MQDGPWRALYPFASHFVDHPDVNGEAVRQHYLDEGGGRDEGADRPGPALVMVHGNPTWSFFFRDWVARWRGRWRCIAPDHVGCGMSGRPQRYPYTLSTHVDNLERLLETALPPADDPRGKIVLIVHDWGGAVGMGYAVRHPERIAKIVAMNTAAWPDFVVPWRIRLCRCPGLGAFLVRGLNLFAVLATKMTTAKPLAPDVRAGYLAPYDSWRARIAVHRFVQDIPLAKSSPCHAALAAIAADLPKLRDVPVLLPWGMRDWCFSPYYLKGWRERFPKARAVEFPDAGHYLLEDEGERAAAEAEKFIAEG